jgi:hypothetical protein
VYPPRVLAEDNIPESANCKGSSAGIGGGQAHLPNRLPGPEPRSAPCLRRKSRVPALGRALARFYKPRLTLFTSLRKTAVLAGFRSKCRPGNRTSLAGGIQGATSPVEPDPAMSCPRLQAPARRLNPQGLHRRG